MTQRDGEKEGIRQDARTVNCHTYGVTAFQLLNTDKAFLVILKIKDSI